MSYCTHTYSFVAKIVRACPKCGLSYPKPIRPYYEEWTEEETASAKEFFDNIGTSVMENK